MSIQLVTGRQVRLAARNNTHTKPTSGLAPGYLQANLIVLPSRYANDFRTLCARNPVPCPLIAESTAKGCFDTVETCVHELQGDQILGEDCDLRRDVPRYNVYKDSVLEKSHCNDIVSEWTEDHVAFLIGCSYSFENDLTAAGLPPRQQVQGRNVPMYRTTVTLCPAGVFTEGTYVVSMRPYKRREIEEVRNITRKFGVTHGEPIDWGWDAVERLGIKDINRPEWGDAPLTMDGRPLEETRRGDGDENEDGDGEIPVFWGCGVTPQEAVMRAKLEGIVMAHAPGHMLVLDARDDDIKA
ncbi:Putative hydro-lyase C5H10.01 [Cladobotryum mycophilum]|uniref:Hydro-lyase C5H10.01 n=1 Tax=Cladobotryum mycophilum TaxID=491253 RepID=A0ABR0SE93_9HYPO